MPFFLYQFKAIPTLLKISRNHSYYQLIKKIGWIPKRSEKNHIFGLLNKIPKKLKQSYFWVNNLNEKA